MTSAFSWQNSEPLPCFILYSEAKLAFYSRYFLTSYFFILVPYDEKDNFFGYQFQKVLQVLIEPFSLFGISGWGIDLDYCDTEWFASETSRNYSVIFEIAPKYCISDSVDYEGYSISSVGFLPTVIHISVQNRSSLNVKVGGQGPGMWEMWLGVAFLPQVTPYKSFKQNCPTGN